jgi:hypothetical protein
VLARALDPDPERRFPSARSFADALERSVDAELVDDRYRTDRRRVHLIGVRSSSWDRRDRDHALGLWLGELEVGGPLGIRAAPDEPASAEPHRSPCCP